MHELSVAAALVTQAQRAAGGDRVVAVHVRLGGLSGLVPDSLEFGFEVAAQGTLVQGARLVIERVEPVMWCPSCQVAVTLASSTRFRCPVCDTASALVLAGRELELCSIEVVDGADAEGADPGHQLDGSRA